MNSNHFVLEELSNRMGDSPFCFIKTSSSRPTHFGSTLLKRRPSVTPSFVFPNGTLSASHSTQLPVNHPNRIDATSFEHLLPMDLKPKIAFAFLLFKYNGLQEIYPMKKLKILIGRSKRNVEEASQTSTVDPKHEPAEEEVLDVELNVPSVSKKNMEIEYNLTRNSFMLHVLGKNTMNVDGVVYARGQRDIMLKNGSQIILGTRVVIKFLLPGCL